MEMRRAILITILFVFSCSFCSGQYFARLAGNKAAISVTYATFDAAQKGTATTLSSGNLVAAMTSNGVAIATISGSGGKSTGKWYWEITMTSAGGNRCIGVQSGLSGLNYNTWLGNNTNGYAYYSTGTGGNWFASGSITFGAFSLDYTTGDIIGVALDAGGNSIQFYKNGVAVTPSESIAGGTYYPGVSANVGTFTANFGATAFSYTPPAGYNSGFY